MNDSTDRELQTIVDATLRPVRASASRKQQVREELLTHVTDVFNEELSCTGDERVALAATRRRFGAAEEVGAQLKGSVPFVERLFLLSEKELLMSGKFWLAAIAAVAVGPAIILPAMAMYRDDGIFNVMPFILGGGILLAGLGMAGYGAIRLLRHS